LTYIKKAACDVMVFCRKSQVSACPMSKVFAERIAIGYAYCVNRVERANVEVRESGSATSKGKNFCDGILRLAARLESFAQAHQKTFA
jgi:hypothetical protein